MNSRLSLAIKLAYKAGKEVMKIYSGDFEVYTKSDLSPLTKADLESEKIIINGIKNEFSQDYILSEESPDGSRSISAYTWVIDPIDGTKEFVNKNDEFTINIGILKDGIPYIGVVYAPCFDELYYGMKNSGSFKCTDGKKTKIRVSNRTDNLIAFDSRSHPSEEYEKMLNNSRVGEVRRMGSSLKACKIAEGVGDLYYRYGKTMLWDTCGVEMIVMEAGGIIRTMDDKAINYMQDDLRNHGFYVLNSSKNDLRLEM